MRQSRINHRLNNFIYFSCFLSVQKKSQLVYGVNHINFQRIYNEPRLSVDKKIQKSSNTIRSHREIERNVPNIQACLTPQYFFESFVDDLKNYASYMTKNYPLATLRSLGISNKIIQVHF